MLYKRHGDTVFRYAWHLLGRREDAEDATQATFLAVHGALANGTAVLDSSSWVLRIARNECMGRLRQMARRPAVGSLDDGFDQPAAGGVERSAELRDELRTAQQTLGNLPEPEREAFVMREWLGLEAGEAALALGMTAGDVDGLASRARRRLVIAVGGLEPAMGCAGTRTAMEAGSLDRAAKVHLLRCPMCRGVRRALRPPDGGAARPAVAQRLSAAIPGFASGGGGILAALTAKAATAPVLAKTAAIVAAAVATGGAVEEAIVRAQPEHRGSHGGAAQNLAAAPVAHHQRSGQAIVLRTVSLRAVHVQTSPAPSSRGAAATPMGKHGSSSLANDHGGHSSGRGESGGDNSGTGKAGGDSGEGKGSGSAKVASSASGEHSSGSDDASSGKGHSSSGGDDHSASGKSGSGGNVAGDSGDSGTGSSSGSDAGSQHHGATVAPAPTDAPSGADSSGGGSGKGSADAAASDPGQGAGQGAPQITDAASTTSSSDGGSD